MVPDVLVFAGLLVVIVLLITLATYNALMQQRQDVRAAWSQMDDQLKNRYLLIPILVEIVRTAGGAAAEKLAPIAAAKNSAAVAFNPVQLAKAEGELSAGIQQLLQAADQQEGLANDPGFIEIRGQLIRSQNQINQATRRYNDKVDALNASMSSFPYVITAKAIGLHLQPLFGV